MEIYVITGAVALILTVLLFFQKKPTPINIPIGFMGIISMGLVIILIFQSAILGKFMVETNGDPAQIVDEFYSNLLGGQYEEAYELLLNYKTLGLENEISDETVEKLEAEMKGESSKVLEDNLSDNEGVLVNTNVELVSGNTLSGNGLSSNTVSGGAISGNFVETAEEDTALSPDISGIATVTGDVRLGEALRKSYSYRLIGEPTINELTAVQKVEFTYLDLGWFERNTAGRIDGLIAEKIKTRTKSQLYDENGEYRDELMSEVYEEALASSLKWADRYYVTVVYDVKLEYVDGSWYIIYSDDMTKGFKGGQ